MGNVFDCLSFLLGRDYLNGNFYQVFLFQRLLLSKNKRIAILALGLNPNPKPNPNSSPNFSSNPNSKSNPNPRIDLQNKTSKRRSIILFMGVNSTVT